MKKIHNFETLINNLFELREINSNFNDSNINKNIQNVINSVPKDKQKIVFSKLDLLLDEYLSNTRNIHKEYYKAGFIDALNLIIPAIFS